MKNSIISLILFFSVKSFAQTRLYELEKQKLDLQIKISNLINQNEVLQKKISDNDAALAQRKKSISTLVRLNRSLNKFNVGGLIALENPLRLNRNLKIVEKTRDKLVVETTEFNLISADFYNQKNILDKQIKELSTAEQLILKQEKVIQEEEKNVIKNLLVAKEKSLLSVKGHLLKPVQCPLQSDFGLVSDPVNKYNLFNKGLLFKCKSDDRVLAVGPGKIIFSDHIPYWGESIIIEHDGGYYSVYTQLSRTQKTKNDVVDRGDVIGFISRAEFYFEFRHQNIPINFKPWIKN